MSKRNFEAALEITDKMRKAYNAVKMLHGKGTSQHLELYVKMIAVKKHKCNIPGDLEAVIDLVEEHQDKPVVVMNLLAAYVDIAEREAGT